MSDIDFTHKLQELMQRVGISSFKALGRGAGISEWQILQLRRGNIEQMRVEVLLKLARSLQISLSELVTTFSQGTDEYQVPIVKTTDSELLQQITELRTEYQRILQTLEQQREVLQQEFQQSSLHILESLLLFWPTIAQKSRDNNHLEVVKIIPLVQKTLDKLLHSWGVEAIAVVGAELPYNPQLHTLIDGTAQPGEIIKVRYVGYRQGDKLLYRAKVSPLK
ncbi:nucleotide exchange factor GrpE [Cronbergia sp. UHCC 0137]|uniref:nucleotide exchange factor GrpE n=1 Tax=Cronbergia sp. UHCC 0137 TaxID=3110239 RepID=UPI002B220FE5|nr:nucleotide exchange factor GrpE [Cronbergia sp. UHCC 0137]MEA5620177.1 nucleotide exchange factor GrpE [Cronbergia sp. UHCC 0137]